MNFNFSDIFLKKYFQLLLSYSVNIEMYYFYLYFLISTFIQSTF